MKNSPPNNVEFNNIPWETPTPGFREKSYVGGGKKLRLIEFTEEFIAQDLCAKGYCGLVLEGEMGVHINGVMHRFRAGDGVIIPSGAKPHRHHATIKATRLFLVDEP